MRTILLHSIALILCIGLTGLSSQKLERTSAGSSTAEAQAYEALYLPRVDALELVSLGYRNALANILWFNTISYFGKHYKTDNNYRWFNHMCDIVSALNPNATHVYHFCSTMLSWEANEPEKSVELLTRAIEHLPDEWTMYYLRGFTYMYFLNDNERAHRDFVEGARKEDAPVFLARLASKKLLNLDKPEDAVNFLQEMLQGAEDPAQRAVLEDRLRTAIHRVNLKVLDTALQRYLADHKNTADSLELLVSSGYISALPRDPWGGRYLIHPETNTAYSDSEEAQEQHREKSNNGQTHD